MTKIFSTFKKLIEECDPSEYLVNIKKLPKTDLHLHSVLSAPFDIYKKLSGGTLKNPPKKFSSLHEFLDYIEVAYLPLLVKDDFFTATTEGMYEFLIEDGVTYCEPSFDLRIPQRAGINWQIFAKILTAINSKFSNRLTIKPDLGICREVLDSEWKEAAFEALEQNVFGAIDIYGNETFCDLTKFKELFDFARKKDVKIKIHTGEICSPEQSRRDIEIAQPEVIQHGIRTVEDPSLLKEIANLGIQLNISVCSNIKLSVIEDYQTHPIRQIFDDGIPVTLNSDDYGVFNVTVSEDIFNLYQAGVFTAGELDVIREYGIALGVR